MTPSTQSHESVGPDGDDRRLAIVARDVHKSYVLGPRRVVALRGASLSVPADGFFAIMGASGSGKSTLLHLLAGLDHPDKGEITVASDRIDRMDEGRLTEYRRRRIGIIFQQFNLIPTMSALDNVLLPGILDGMSSRELRPRGEALLERLGLSDRAGHRPDALSGGEQQRVAIARALFFEPPVLFADEPTGNLDSESAAQLWDVLKSLGAERDLTVLMVTHEPTAAIHCERVFVLRDGAIEGTFDVDAADATELAARYQQLVGPARQDRAHDRRGLAGGESGRRGLDVH